MYWDGAYTKRAYWDRLAIPRFVGLVFPSKVGFSWFFPISWFENGGVHRNTPPKIRGLGTMKPAPKPPKIHCYASVLIRIPRASSAMAAPQYPLPTTLVRL